MVVENLRKLSSKVSRLSIGGNKTINFEGKKCVLEKGGDKLQKIRKVLFVIKLALVLVLCFVIVRTVIMPQQPAGIFIPVSAVGTENVSANEAENPVEASAEDYSAIIERNIFGVADSSGLADKSPQDNRFDGVVKLAEEELGLELVGTVCGSTEVSRAIIKKTKTGQLNIYKTGQNVEEAHIKSIENNAVILLHNGQRKMLVLNRTGGHNENVQAPSSGTINQAGNVAGSVLAVKQPLTLIPEMITRVEAILAEAVIEPYVANDQVEGLRMTGLENIPMAKDLGLKDGDIIRVVNGHRLTSKQKALQVFRKARSQEAVSLELLRDGETKELSFTLQ
jgi:type II secretion system protein C